MGQPDEYARRGGYLTGFAYAFCGSDAHGENVRPAEGYPVVLDAETFLGNETPGLPGNLDGARRMAQVAIDSSVLATMLLPVRAKAGARSVDLGGLSAGGQMVPLRQADQWRHLGTDGMERVVHGPAHSGSVDSVTSGAAMIGGPGGRAIGRVSGRICAVTGCTRVAPPARRHGGQPDGPACAARFFAIQAPTEVCYRGPWNLT